MFALTTVRIAGIGDKLGYRLKEVPVSKIYPSEKKSKYTKIRPFIDWWKIARPLFYLILGIRR